MNSSTPPRDPKGSSPIIPFESEDFRWNKLFKWSAQAWFTVAVIGQIIFAIYVALNYGVPAFEKDYQAWNETLPHGHEEGNTRGNFFIGAHLFLR